MNLVNMAANWATIAHLGQIRKYTNYPYIAHPAEVALLVDIFGGSEEQIAAAWLHDVVEDTPTTLNEVEMIFGQKIANLVGELTDHFTKENFPDYNRAKRKEAERERLYKISPEAAFVKACDMIDNTRDIKEFDPDYAKVYLREKARLALNMAINEDALRQTLLDQIPERYLEEVKNL